MKIFIVGGTGYLGHRVVKELLYDGTLTLRLLYRNAETLPEFSSENRENVSWISSNVKNVSIYSNELNDCDIVLYMGGINSPGIETKREKLIEENVTNLSIFLSELKRKKPELLIYVSDVCAMGDTGNLSYENDKENSGNFSSYYEESKYLGLVKVKEYAKEHKTIIAHVGPTFGYEDPGFLWKLIKKAALKKMRKVVAPYHFLSPIYIEDLKEGILQLLIRGEEGKEYTLCGEPIEFQNIFYVVYSIVNCKHHSGGLTGLRAYLHSFFNKEYNFELVRYLCNASYAFTSFKSKRDLRWSHGVLKEKLIEILIEAEIIKSKENNN